MLKIVVDDNDNIDYDINEMEMWHNDIKEKVSKVGKDKKISYINNINKIK